MPPAVAMKAAPRPPPGNQYVRTVCCQPPELAEAVEKEVIDYEGYEEFPGVIYYALGSAALADPEY